MVDVVEADAGQLEGAVPGGPEGRRTGEVGSLGDQVIGGCGAGEREDPAVPR